MSSDLIINTRPSERQAGSGAILVGGQSRRMGADKALMQVSGARPLIAGLVEVLASVCAEVLLVGGEPATYRSLGLAARWAPDASDGTGPLAGILGALVAARGPWCCVVACDMPFVHAELIAAMAGALGASDVLAYPRAGGFEPLLAIYRPTCVPVLRAMLQRGELRAQAIIRHLRVDVLPPTVLATVDPAGWGPTNVNTPAELDAARQLAAWMTGWDADM